LSLKDLGVSAYKGTHRTDDKHALAQFLRLVDRGSIAAGSYLIIENLDRLSREDERTALRLWMDILDRKIHIVQLEPETVFRHEKSDMLDIMRAIMELARGHSESRMKSERVGKAWREKKRQARNGVLLTNRVPAWLEVKDGKLKLLPKAAKAVRRIYELAAAGKGIPSILQQLEKERVPPIGRDGQWNRAYLGLLLKDRRLLGEYEPKKGNGKHKDGEVITNYYPPAITQDQWDAARASILERRKGRSRVGNRRVNLFNGLLKHARDGDSYIMTTRYSRVPGKPTRKYNALVNYRADQGLGGVRAYSLPYDVFEAAVLSCLKEIDPHDILNGDHPPDESERLAGQLVGVEAELAALAAYMDGSGFSPTLGQRVTTLEARKKELGAQLAEARQRARHPLSESWGEAQTLADALATAPDPQEARLRLRAALRRIVAEIVILIMPHGQDRLAAIQVNFVGRDRRRDYLLMYRPGSGKRRAASWVRSFADSALPDNLDLRRPDHVRRLEQELATVELEENG
jgi:DNA invertase Pin-like site-specific DNA recombinase